MRSFAAFVLLLAACADRVEVQAVTLRLRTLPVGPCSPPSTPSDLLLEAFGDFPASDERTIEVLRPMSEPGIVDRFPPGTLAVSVRARGSRWEGFGLLPMVRAGTDAQLLLLPPDTSCLVADPALRDMGSALTPLADGSLVLAGGVDGLAGSRRLVHWYPGDPVARTLDPGLLLRREGAASVAVGSRVFILGGALGAEGPAHDTFEVYDAQTDGRSEALGALAEPRREAGVARLPDGRVLLVGGRSRGGGAPLASAEVIDPRSGDAEIVGELAHARTSPWVLTLDDGSVLVAGGRGPSGAVRALEAFDPRSGDFISLPLELPAEPQAAVALPGGRLAVFAASRPGEVTVYRNAPPILGPVPGLVAQEVTLALPALESLAASALFDGSILVVGRDGSQLRAFVVDVGAAAVRELGAPRALGRLVPLADGSTAALDAEGLALRRTTERTPFAHPPAILFAEDLALDGPGRWRRDGAAMVGEAVDSRADLAGLRFADFVIEVETTGAAEVLLQPDGAPALAVRLEANAVGPALCTLEGAEGPVRIERRGDRLRIERGGDARECRVDGLEARVGLAFRARRGTRIERLTAQRLETP